MFLKRSVGLAILFGVVGCTGKQSVPSFDENAGTLEPTSATPSVREIANRYEGLTLITKEPVKVDPYLASYCVSAAEFVKAAKIRNGPHAGAAVRIFMNEKAAEIFHKGGKVYPAGAVVVKEKQRLEPDGGERAAGKEESRGSDGVGGMIKRAAGYDPDHGDWEYFYFEDPEKIEQGKIASCVECHRGAAATDHVFGSWSVENETADN